MTHLELARLLRADRDTGMEALLRQQDVSVKIYCQRFGKHCEADWEKQVPIFMNYLWLEG